MVPYYISGTWAPFSWYILLATYARTNQFHHVSKVSSCIPCARIISFFPFISIHVKLQSIYICYVHVYLYTFETFSHERTNVGKNLLVKFNATLFRVCNISMTSAIFSFNLSSASIYSTSCIIYYPRSSSLPTLLRD